MNSFRLKSISNNYLLIQDALGVAKVQKENLDFEYLKKWGDVLGVGDLLERFIKEVKEE